jgi:carboxypeptidase C (cathepsin A)
MAASVIKFQVSSLLVLDLPVGTGFSYARTPLALQRSDFKQVSHAEQFLRKVTFWSVLRLKGRICEFILVIFS